jgi:hypothetical protein
MLAWDTSWSTISLQVMRMFEASGVERTSAPNSARLPPSGPVKKRMKMTIACAATSCGSLSRTPAACVSLAPAKRIESSRSRGMPSSCEPDVSSWATVANGFFRGENCIANCVRIVLDAVRTRAVTFAVVSVMVLGSWELAGWS